MFEDVEKISKAKVLLEALPYIQKFQKTIFVIKYGGSFMDAPDTSVRTRVAKDLALMAAVGIHVVIVHGGGKAISRNMQTAAIKPTFINGLRYTDQATIKIVEKTLNEQLNPEICAFLETQGAQAQSLKGNSILRCSKRHVYDEKQNPIDYGYVGDIEQVNSIPIKDALSKGKTPVISPVAIDKANQTYNVNADSAASEIAIALGAKRLFYLCDTPGLLTDPKDEKTLMSTLHVNEAESLKGSGIIAEGMQPKVESAIKAIKNKVQRVHFIGGHIPHSLLLEIFTDKGIGTEIIL